ncbi:hypothetical protein [Chitinophaga caseinilytica]|uniref:hypothetical protein n=1 Tax=Chitinophaga caseinilytica TaxID=2267521 RepID=UPI003C309690
MTDLRNIILQVALLLSVFLLPGVASAQQYYGRVCFLGDDTAAVEYPCMALPPTVQDSLAENTMQQLLRPLGLRGKILLRGCDEVRNFASLISARDNTRYVLYSKTAFDSAVDVRHKNWDKMAVYLHELGHHLNGNTSGADDGQKLQNELDADYFSGYNMARLKAPLPESQKYLTMVPNPPCEDEELYSHPCLEARTLAVTRGWYGGKDLADFYVESGYGELSGTGRMDELERGIQKPFFTYSHCVRSGDPCKCIVLLNGVRMRIDYSHQQCFLDADFSDSGCGTCGHGAMDTTLTARGTFRGPWELMPDEKLWIDFGFWPLSETLIFTGKIDRGGSITGYLVIPGNQRGWGLPPEDDTNVASFVLKGKPVVIVVK